MTLTTGAPEANHVPVDVLGGPALEGRLGAGAAEGPAALPYLSALVRDGARRYLDNGDVEVKALSIGATILPLVVSHGDAGNSEVCSPYSHYVRYIPEAQAKLYPGVPRFLFQLRALPTGLLLRLGQIDRVLYVNNWLLSTNPSPRLSAAEIAALTTTLTSTYVDSAIVFRSVNPRLDAPLADALQQGGYRLIRSRTVYVLDPTNPGQLAHENIKRDRALLRRIPYEVVTRTDELGPHAERLAVLYRDLYLQKYPSLNPQFNAAFFALTLRTGLFTYLALRRNGRVDAFMAYLVDGPTIVSGVIGYDRALPRALGLYRSVFALLIAVATERRLPLNMSAGAGHFKMLRGAEPVEEFDAVYDRHLHAHRRAAWAGLMIASRRGRLRRPEDLRPRRVGPVVRGRRRHGSERVAALSAPDARTRAASMYWDQVLASTRGAARIDLWRAYMQGVYSRLLRGWLPSPEAGRGLKTDLFEEAITTYDLLPQLGAGSVGLDCSPTIVCAARARLEARAGWYLLLACDVRQLPFRSASVARILSGSSLDHFRDKADIARSIAELARILSPGGTLVITFDNPHNPVIWLRRRLSYRVLHRLHILPYYVGETYGMTEARERLRRLGFAVTDVAVVAHAPRALAIWMVALAERLGWTWLHPLISRALNACEALARWPTRYVTGYYLALRAEKQDPARAGRSS